VTVSTHAHIGVVGGGILGVAIARELLASRPGSRVTVLEKEPGLARHQSGRNSGVVHAGLYYEPGSLKARLCRRGGELLRTYCEQRGLPYHACGKVLVATDDAEAHRLTAIRERAERNGVPDVRLLDQGELRAVEPHARGVAALHSPATAVVDFGAVTRALADDVAAAGGEIRTRAAVRRVRRLPRDAGVEVTLAADGRRLRFDALVICAGLHSDRLAVQAGDDPEPRIVAFRGEYHRLAAHRRHLVRGLIYPVPDPSLPFLGVHLSRGVDGEVSVGPNAVLATAREGYRRRDVDLADLREALAWPGTRALARRYWRVGAAEVLGSLSRAAFARAVRRYVPAVRTSDLRPGRSGVRAQALTRDGRLVDDFWISRLGTVVCLRNAPSPAATSSLAIAEHVVGLLAGE
jgi:(S)-2-hydroxyglutarate dehydrogenase